MTQVTNVTVSFNAVGNREDLSDMIYNVDPTDTPIVTAVKSSKATAVLHEWQTDTLDAASGTNQVQEGATVAATAFTATVRESNTCEIAQKAFAVSGTQMAVRPAGRKDELAYQALKATKALRRDIEKSLFGVNTAETTNANTTARKAGAFETWITSNVSRAGDGASGSRGNSTATDGTQRAFDESLVKQVLALAWDNGGDPDCIFLGSFNKQVYSGFAGNATRFKTAEDRTLVATIDVYQSDFGEIRVYPSRWSRSRTALLIQKEFVGVAWLRPVHQVELAKTGDAELREVIGEYTLEVLNEKAHGVVADLTTS